jgi:hypothetical protein
MKKHFLVGFVVALAAVGTAGAQSFQAPVSANKPVQRPPAQVSPGRPVGAFPRVRASPLQLINPRAPQRYYGPPQETVASNDVGQGQPRSQGESANSYTGVILFGLRW